jgi:sugar phosphate isomerase/epimerase
MTSLPHVGVQLWAVRDALATDLPGTIARLAGLGFATIEPFDLLADPAGLAAAMKASGLRAITAHARATGPDALALSEVATSLGIATLIVPWTEPERFASRESVRDVAAELNDRATELAAHGLQLGYHNHWFELEAVFDGRTALEWLVDDLDPGVVLELDTYWAAAGGQDVPALLARLGDRVRFLHLKDGPLEPREPHVALGDGVMPVRAILDAATACELAVVELDSFDGDVFTALADSLAFLGGMAS